MPWKGYTGIGKSIRTVLWFGGKMVNPYGLTVLCLGAVVAILARLQDITIAPDAVRLWMEGMRMIKVFCDKCEKDCGLNAYALTVEIINNPCPVHIFDVGDLKITCDHTKMRMIVCQDCYRSLGMPNIHKAVREKKLTWRERREGE